MKYIIIIILITLLGGMVFAQTDEECERCKKCLPLANEVKKNASEYEQLKKQINASGDRDPNSDLNKKFNANRNQARQLQEKLTQTGCWGFSATNCDNFCKDQQQTTKLPPIEELREKYGHIKMKVSTSLWNGETKELYEGRSTIVYGGGRLGTVVVTKGKIGYDQRSSGFIIPEGCEAKMTYQNDGTELILKGGSEVYFHSEYNLQIIRGSCNLWVDKKGSKFEIKTPTWVLGVKGTQFEVKVNPDQSSEVYLFEGVVSVSNNTEEILLNPGEMAVSMSMDDTIVVKNFDVNNPSITWPIKETPSGNTKSINGNEWKIQNIPGSAGEIQSSVTTELNNNCTPIGFNRIDHSSNILYLESNPFNITTWNMEWYQDFNQLQNGLNTNMSNGYIPMGISFSDYFYVFYVMCDVKGNNWQIVESVPDLQTVSQDIQPYVDQSYVPFGITVYENKYYTLLVEIPGNPGMKWSIEGYNNNEQDIKAGVEKNVTNDMVPFGFLKQGNIVNVLYVKF